MNTTQITSILAVGTAALVYPFLKFALAKLRDAAWREIDIMRRLMPRRAGNREGECLFD